MKIDTTVVTLEGLLTGLNTKFVVPDYQRDYAWKTSEAEELWADITTAYRSNIEYFMGAVVLNASPESENTFEIVDGQQRLTTFAILFAAIASVGDQFSEDERIFPESPRSVENTKLAAKIGSLAKSRLYYTSEPDNYYLTSNKKDSAVFNALVKSFDKVLWDEEEQRFSAANESRVGKANKIIYKCIKKEFTGTNAIVDLYQALVHFVQKLKFIKIYVGSDTDAFLLFESLNSKGLDLSTADLVKNKLLQLSGESLQVKASILASWDQMISNLENKSRIGVVDFLRIYWIAFKGGLITKKELYKAIKDFLKSERERATLTHPLAESVKELACDLQSKSNIYSVLTDKNLSWPAGAHRAEKHLRLMSEINQLKYTLCHPAILFAAAERPEQLENTVRLSLSFLFRWVTICDLSVGSAHEVLNSVLSNLRNKKLIDPRLIFAPITDENSRIGDDLFVEAFKKFRTEDNALAKYILGKIHAEVSGQQVVPNFHEIHLEHVLPQHVEKWREAGDFKIAESNSNESWKPWIYHLGNMTLLDKEINSGIKDGVFDEKAVEYAGSPFPMTDKLHKEFLAGMSTWSIERISERAAEWAPIAKQIWSIEIQ